jgi:uncharacterized protein YbjT (DUF2867 family)
MTQTVLLAGATGRLGGKIAHQLLDRPEARVRLLVRGGNVPDKRSALDPLLMRGAPRSLRATSPTAPRSTAARKAST